MTSEVLVTSPKPAEIGGLSDMLDADIGRSGSLESFMIRAGLLRDILDELYDHRAYRNRVAGQVEPASVLQAFVDQARVGKGTAAVAKSKWVHAPAAIYHRAVAALSTAAHSSQGRGSGE